MRQASMRLLKILKRCTVLIALLSVSGCYLKIITSEGGYVESASPYRGCPTNQICEVMVDTINFSETFTAIANEGYVFLGWAKGPGFICGNAAGNICNIALNWNQDLGPIVHSERTGYLMPIFEKLDVSSPAVQPHLKDANGTIVGYIGGDEGYGAFEDIRLDGMNSYIRVAPSGGWQAWTSADIYFEGDDCDLEAPRVFAKKSDYIPEVGPGKGFAKVHGQSTHIFEHLGNAGDFLVGSRWTDGQCENIVDLVLVDHPHQLRWIRIDDFALPFTRHGPPPCTSVWIEGCY